MIGDPNETGFFLLIVGSKLILNSLISNLEKINSILPKFKNTYSRIETYHVVDTWEDILDIKNNIFNLTRKLEFLGIKSDTIIVNFKNYCALMMMLCQNSEATFKNLTLILFLFDKLLKNLNPTDSFKNSNLKNPQGVLISQMYLDLEIGAVKSEYFQKHSIGRFNTILSNVFLPKNKQIPFKLYYAIKYYKCILESGVKESFTKAAEKSLMKKLLIYLKMITKQLKVNTSTLILPCTKEEYMKILKNRKKPFILEILDFLCLNSIINHNVFEYVQKYSRVVTKLGKSYVLGSKDGEHATLGSVQKYLFLNTYKESIQNINPNYPLFSQKLGL